jgi:hypothetical protein
MKGKPSTSGDPTGLGKIARGQPRASLICSGASCFLRLGQCVHALPIMALRLTKTELDSLLLSSSRHGPPVSKHKPNLTDGLVLGLHAHRALIDSQLAFGFVAMESAQDRCRCNTIICCLLTEALSLLRKLNGPVKIRIVSPWTRIAQKHSRTTAFCLSRSQICWIGMKVKRE